MFSFLHNPVQCELNTRFDTRLHIIFEIIVMKNPRKISQSMELLNDQCFLSIPEYIQKFAAFLMLPG